MPTIDMSLPKLREYMGISTRPADFDKFWDDAIAERLLINQNDVSDLKAFYTVEAGKGNRVILFRFANTDYYAAPAFRSGYSGSYDDDDW